VTDQQDPPQGTSGSGGQPGDETWSTYSPPTSYPAAEAADTELPAQALPPTHVPYGTKQNYTGTYPPAPGSPGFTVTSDLVSTSNKGCGWIGAVIAMVVFIPTIIGVIAGIKAISGGFDELEDGLTSPFAGGEPPNLRTAAAFDDLLTAVREETGSTTVLEAVLYPEYAVVWVPVDKTSKRYYSYYYDGELSKSSQGSTDYTRYDLSTIDAKVVSQLFKRATQLIDEPESTYVIIRAPGEHDNGAWFSVHASNDFMESGYFTADKTGKTVFEYNSP